LFKSPALSGPHADSRRGSLQPPSPCRDRRLTDTPVARGDQFFFSDKDHRRLPGTRIPSRQMYTPPRCAHQYSVVYTTAGNNNKM